MNFEYNNDHLVYLQKFINEIRDKISAHCSNKYETFNVSDIAKDILYPYTPEAQMMLYNFALDRLILHFISEYYRNNL